MAVRLTRSGSALTATSGGKVATGFTAEPAGGNSVRAYFVRFRNTATALLTNENAFGRLFQKGAGGGGGNIGSAGLMQDRTNSRLTFNREFLGGSYQYSQIAVPFTWTANVGVTQTAVVVFDTASPWACEIWLNGTKYTVGGSPAATETNVAPAGAWQASASEILLLDRPDGTRQAALELEDFGVKDYATIAGAATDVAAYNAGTKASAIANILYARDLASDFTSGAGAGTTTGTSTEFVSWGLPLAAACVATPTATAELTTSIALSATCVASATAAAELQVTVPWTATCLARSAASAALTTGIALTAACLASPSATAELIVDPPWAATCVARTAGAANLNPKITLRADFGGANLLIGASQSRAILTASEQRIIVYPRTGTIWDSKASILYTRYWGWMFKIRSDQPFSPDFEQKTSTPAWHPLVDGSTDLTNYAPYFSFDGGVTWQRFDVHRVGTKANAADTTTFYFHDSTQTWPAETDIIVSFDRPYTLDVPGGIEDTLAQLLAGADGAKFTPVQTMPGAPWTPAYGGAAVKAHIYGMTTGGKTRSGTGDDGATTSSWPVYASVIDDASLAPPAGAAAKKWIVLIGGVHASEWDGFASIKGFVNQFLAGDAYGAFLRTHFRVVVAWNGNADGRQEGHLRGAYEDIPVGGAGGHANASWDYNREWNTTSSVVTERLKAIIAAATGNQGVAWFYDGHGQFDNSQLIETRNTTSHQRYIAKLGTYFTVVSANDENYGHVINSTLTDTWKSWSYGFDTLGAWHACIHEQNTLTNESEATRMANAAGFLKAFRDAAEENLLVVTPGTIVAGVPQTIIVATPSGNLPSGVTPASGTITVAIAGLTVTTTWNGAAKRWEAVTTFPDTSPRAITVTNSASLINPVSLTLQPLAAWSAAALTAPQASAALTTGIALAAQTVTRPIGAADLSIAAPPWAATAVLRLTPGADLTTQIVLRADCVARPVASAAFQGVAEVPSTLDFDFYINALQVEGDQDGEFLRIGAHLKRIRERSMQ